jgi:hypothetical protein
LKGAAEREAAIVLAGRHTLVPAKLTPPARRRTDEEVRAQCDPDHPNAGCGGRAAAIAATLHQLAMRDEMRPRLPARPEPAVHV